MKLKAFFAFKGKLSKPWPCRTRCLVLPSFRFRLKRPIWVRIFRTPKKAYIRKRISDAFRPVFRPSVIHLEEMDQLEELRSVTEPERGRLLFPSPTTPAYVRVNGARKKEVAGEDDVEDACRSFETYLMEMIVEEGKVRDLMDVEELLQCWKDLKCPVFTSMVCRFYGEVCKDLFSGE
ncbi:transcription repressor OFP17-like [Macadamia integrifolia]|uniref:transcription repressor OFP17-like n=1 Tax=Macadamia integrifolia TaxID=60698 RepID=UPI001C5306B8|nr:transcription repressor OFP17-like [Macadamia integrifolia]